MTTDPTTDLDRVRALMREAYLAGDMLLAAACGCVLDEAADRVWPSLDEARDAVRDALADAEAQGQPLGVA